jgi:hypothetical protein
MFVRLARRKNTSVDNQERLWILTFSAARIIMSRVANIRRQLEAIHADSKRTFESIGRGACANEE